MWETRVQQHFTAESLQAKAATERGDREHSEVEAFRQREAALMNELAALGEKAQSMEQRANDMASQAAKIPQLPRILRPTPLPPLMPSDSCPKPLLTGLSSSLLMYVPKWGNTKLPK